jgi:hypothetical protein
MQRSCISRGAAQETRGRERYTGGEDRGRKREASLLGSYLDRKQTAFPAPKAAVYSRRRGCARGNDPAGEKEKESCTRGRASVREGARQIAKIPVCRRTQGRQNQGDSNIQSQLQATYPRGGVTGYAADGRSWVSMAFPCTWRPAVHEERAKGIRNTSRGPRVSTSRSRAQALKAPQGPYVGVLLLPYCRIFQVQTRQNVPEKHGEKRDGRGKCLRVEAGKRDDTQGDLWGDTLLCAWLSHFRIRLADTVGEAIVQQPRKSQLRIQSLASKFSLSSGQGTASGGDVR